MTFDANFPNGTRVLQPFNFEYLVDEQKSRAWVEKYQTPVVYASVGYVILTFLGQEFMRNRKPYKLKRALTIWNAFLAIFSILGFLRTAPSLFGLLFQPNGYYRSLCTFDYLGEPDLFWAFMYTISKLFEFIDTAFIIARGGTVIFLHWFHHMSMAIFMFYLYPIGDPLGRYGVILNYGVHGVMYSYYAMRMAGIHIPKRISSQITTLQMGQFIAAFIVVVSAAFNSAIGYPCTLSKTTLSVMAFGSVAYLSLFANFYYQTYIKKKQKKVD